MTQANLQKLLSEIKSDLIQLYGDQLVAVVLYGSYARDKAGKHSDLDIAMVLKDYENEFPEIDRTSMIASRLSLDYDTTVSLIPLREKNWRENQSPFYENIHREGITTK